MSKTKLFSYSKHAIISAFFTFLLVSCSSPQKVSGDRTNSINDQLVDNAETQVKHISAQEYLQKAELASTEQATELMIKASDAFLIEENYLSSLWLANQMTFIAKIPSHKYQLYLIKANALQSLNEIEKANKQLKLADSLIQDNDMSHSLRYFQLKATIEKQRNLMISSLDANMHSFSLDSEATNDNIFQIWDDLSRLAQWQVQQLVSLQPPFIEGWAKLLSYAHQFGINHQRFHQYLTLWQRQFPSHPANVVVNSLKVSTLSEESIINNITVILPLSGKQEIAGKVAQQGLLAAYNNDTSLTLHFIDSNELDMSTLNDIFTENNTDYVIGPLLKENVDSYVEQQAITIPTLLLNLPNQSLMRENHIVLSMRREDEAVQAASTLSKRNYKHPIIFSLQDNVSPRIATSFAQQWQLVTGELPETVYFNKNDNMQSTLKSSLDVDKSQQRIKSLESVIKQKIKSESRNRHDIDMIYLVGSPRETRLLKPYIDVNISTFSSEIPTFASSFSHSGNMDVSESRDLTGLSFTEIPWLLQSKSQNKELAELSRQLWPERSDSLQRIFAMGFDSLSLVSKLSTMQKSPYIRHFGQTGVLKLNANNILTRSLLWGRYFQGKEQEIAMD